MRSVVVVLPASMWATIPMFRILSSETRSVIAVFFVSSCVAMNPLPSIVRERLIGLGHLVRVLAALHRGAGVVAGIQDLRREPLPHRLAGPLAGVLDEPPHAERDPPVRPDLDRHLVGRAANPAGADLQDGHDVVERLL